MSVSYQIFYTKGFLLELKKRLNIIKEVYDILSRKRDELVAELMRGLEELKKLRKKAISDIMQVYTKYLEALPAIPPDALESAVSVRRGSLELVVLPISLMGVILPRIKVVKTCEETPSTNPLITILLKDSSKLLTEFIKLVELEALIESLAIDLERTNKIVNALEKIVIPELTETIKKIQEIIEEEMIEELGRLKMIRNKIASRRRLV